MLTTKNLTSSNFKQGIIRLYHLLASLDGKYGDKEEYMLKHMMAYEGISNAYLKTEQQKFSESSMDEIRSDTKTVLQRCEHEEKVRCVAWIARIANADGFMSSGEWSLIYDTYKKCLKVDLNEVMTYELPEISA